MAPVDCLVHPLRLGASKAETFFFGLSAYPQYISARTCGLRNPVLAGVDYVLDCAHVDEPRRIDCVELGVCGD